jgi:hypothetical protein
LSRKSGSRKKESPSPRGARKGADATAAYCVVFVVSVCVRRSDPAGVSMRVVERERDVSVDCGFAASIVRLVDEELGAGFDGSTTVVEDDGAEGSTTVVEELGADGASRTVSFSFWTTVGSLTTVLDEEGAAGRSQPASAATASAARTGIAYLIEISIQDRR